MQGLTAPILHFLAANWLPVLVAVTAAWLARNRFQKGLHKYPGPFLASLTDFWRVWDVYKQRPEVTHRKLHERYGDVVRLGPNALSFSDPKALKAIYGLNKNMVKSDFYIVQQSVVKGRRLPSLFSTVDESFHAKFRRCVNAAFAMSALVQYEPFVDNTTKLFLDQTQRLFADKPAGDDSGCDFGRWLQFYAFDVIGEITYSKRHGFVEKNEDIDGIVSYLSKLFLYVAPVGQMPLLDLLFLKNPVYLKLSQWGLFDSTFPVAKFARARMAERLPAGGSMNGGFGAGADEKPAAEPHPSTKSPDLLSKFLAAQEARPDFMDDSLVQTMAVSMAFAGSETTAISLSAVFYYLLRNPSAMARLRREIDDAARRGEFEDGETGLVTWHESQRLPYLDACVKEAFRVHPAAGLPLERIVPEGGMEIAGHFVPGGTIVGVSAWVIHNNKDIFGEDVDVYRPERWLIDEELVKAAGPAGDEVRAREEQRIKEMGGLMMQFGMGSRTCIGKNISLLEIYKLVPSLLRRFDIDFKDPQQEWELVNAWFVKQNNFWAKFKTRELVQPDEKSGAIAR
ncbi:hypothetical protein MCOR29_011034 [Pyricularia oryzae]|nr:hypothetical protein MCOR29_011034 [Pyricularia oryzae]KAI6452007.1 hypothetical protein MCOR22_001076 [Pyricularia oryzae]KAI6492284.1 hypothetical protein MCOR11_006763 [Pyricularia oryzae]KAI6530832.1 hypothetical protein MCOR05_007577 [Pyricularia oryzae]KAI6599530.1 hypothetical protein MCOR06_001175 [Pyricularia oryzae]